MNTFRMVKIYLTTKQIKMIDGYTKIEKHVKKPTKFYKCFIMLILFLLRYT